MHVHFNLCYNIPFSLQFRIISVSILSKILFLLRNWGYFNSFSRYSSTLSIKYLYITAVHNLTSIFKLCLVYGNSIVLSLCETDMEQRHCYLYKCAFHKGTIFKTQEFLFLRNIHSTIEINEMSLLCFKVFTECNSRSAWSMIEPANNIL